MDVGGVEKAFLGLLSVIPLDQYEVHVGLVNRKGGYLSYLPKEVQIHEISIYQKYWRSINEPPIHSINSLLTHGHIIDALVYALLYIHFKLSNNRYWFYKYILRNEPVSEHEYDMAVAFAGPAQMVDYYICEKIKAPIKCGWIHFDVSKFGIDKEMIRQLYKDYKKVFVVSQTGKEVFDQTFPELKEKTEVFYNIISPQQVRKLSHEGHSFDDVFEGKRILTVGRVSEEKGQRFAIEALKLLIDNGYNVKWYFVGDGKDKLYCEDFSKQLGISNRVDFLGTQINPYAFMRDCDVYMQPSRHEGFCITLAEALCFRNPIVATDFTGAKEQLQQRPNGIVTGMSAKEMAMGVIDALKRGPIEVVDEPHYRNDISKLFSLLE